MPPRHLGVGCILRDHHAHSQTPDAYCVTITPTLGANPSRQPGLSSINPVETYEFRRQSLRRLLEAGAGLFAVTAETPEILVPGGTCRTWL